MRRSSSRALLAALVAAAVAPRAAGAQLPATRPHLPWRTVETPHFRVHHPTELAAWAGHVASRLESVRGAVADVVGFAPPERVDVVIEDPFGVPNGSAYPVVGASAMIFWATPPSPRTSIGFSRGWGELLAVHEFAHVAHMARPTRSPRERLLALLWPPFDRGPVARRIPRWMWEGYATLVEGRLTGSGRPHNAWRAAVLRQWALEGRIPTHAQVSGAGGFRGGEFAYLAGSAFLEWLVRGRGDSSLVHVWRRLSARQSRTFPEAFAGVYGEPPDVLYARFAAELAHAAFEARERLAAEGLVEGDLVQKLSWEVGDPALSPDGRRIAIALRSPGSARVVVWSAEEAPDTAALRAEARARDRLLRRDPQDVPAVRIYPRPRRALATLRDVRGRAYENPRWLPDGRRVVVTRQVPRADGTSRSDLFVWDTRTGHVRRVTRGAGILSADPTPDGRAAAALRCALGRCDVVVVDLAGGAVREIVRGGLERSAHRPRVSPDGRSVLFAASDESGRWRLAIAPLHGGAPRFADPDDGANRYDGAFARDGRGVIAVAEHEGIANIEWVDPAGGPSRTLTRVTGGAYGPEPAPDGSILFLSLHARGLDLRRLRPGAPAPRGSVALDSTLAPAVVVRAARVPAPFRAGPTGAPRPYGVGPQRRRAYPGAALGADGSYASLSVAGSDPVGRLAWAAQLAVGPADGWRGGAASAVWRGTRPTVAVDVFALRHAPRELATVLQTRDGGVLASLSLDRARDRGAGRLRVGAALVARRSGADASSDGPRRLLFTEAAQSGLALRRGPLAWAQGGAVHLAAGSTGGESWRRGLATSAFTLTVFGRPLRGDAAFALATADAPAYELPALGGVPAPFVDGALYAMRLAQPALPTGALAGPRALSARATLPLFSFAPYYWVGSAGSSLDRWSRVIGAEQGFALPSRGVDRRPETRLLLGAGYSLDAPAERELRLYGWVTYRP